MKHEAKHIHVLLRLGEHAASLSFPFPSSGLGAVLSWETDHPGWGFSRLSSVSTDMGTERNSKCGYDCFVLYLHNSLLAAIFRSWATEHETRRSATRPWREDLHPRSALGTEVSKRTNAKDYPSIVMYLQGSLLGRLAVSKWNAVRSFRGCIGSHDLENAKRRRQMQTAWPRTKISTH
jgi:hypothetical protein